MAFQIHTEGVQFFRFILTFAFVRHYIEFLFDFFQETDCIITVQVFYHTVVIHDIQFICREQNGQIEVEFFFPCVVRIFFSAFQGNFYRRSISVVAVCNIEVFCALECLYQHTDFHIAVHYPYSVADTIFCNEVIFRFFHGCPAVDDGSGIGVISVSQEDGACVGVQGIHVADTVCFLIGSCQFVFFDGAVDIFVNGSTAHQTCLAFAVHSQAVDIQVGQEILTDDTVADHIQQVILCFFVYFIAVNICADGQVNFCLIYMQEGPGFVLYHFSCFFAVHDIIGQCRYLICIVEGRADGHKRSDGCHICFLLCGLSVKYADLKYSVDGVQVCDHIVYIFR